MRKSSPSRRFMSPNWAPQMRVAFSSMLWNTGSKSPADRLITLKHFGRRRLLLQRFGKLARSCLHLLEQPHIADGDHGLVGKSLQQADLLVAERTHFGAPKHNRADALAFAQQWNTQHRANIRPSRKFAGVWKYFSFGSEKVMHMHRLAVDNRATGDPLAIDGLPVPDNRNRSVLGLKQQVVAVLQGCKGVVRLAKLTGAFDNRIKHWFDIGRRGGDHTKDIAASGLVGQRLREIARAWPAPPRTGAHCRWRSRPGRRRSAAERSACR